jgi:hypothetical protein
MEEKSTAAEPAVISFLFRTQYCTPMNVLLPEKALTLAISLSSLVPMMGWSGKTPPEFTA